MYTIESMGSDPFRAFSCSNSTIMIGEMNRKHETTILTSSKGKRPGLYIYVCRRIIQTEVDC